MKHSSVEELKPVATITSVPSLSRAELRVARLQRFASLLEAYDAEVSLFTRVEYMDNHEANSLRSDRSPLAVAFADPMLRMQGLKSDVYKDATEFFDLTAHEAHHLLCDCHYLTRKPSSSLVAARVRSLARRSKVAVFWKEFVQGVKIRFRLRTSNAS